jgi:hypothetical protein
VRRNRAPAVTLTDDQRSAVDEVVLAVIRGLGRATTGVRAGELLGEAGIDRALRKLPKAKSDYRYLGESLQRLKQAGKIELVRNRWRTSSPTS